MIVFVFLAKRWPKTIRVRDCSASENGKGSSNVGGTF